MLFPPLLSWTHYLIPMRVESPRARAFYEIEAARESWSTRELERQVASLLYERVAKSRDKDQVVALAKEGQRVAEPRDVLKDPMVLEFLELEHERSAHTGATGNRLGLRSAVVAVEHLGESVGGQHSLAPLQELLGVGALDPLFDGRIGRTELAAEKTEQ